MKIPIWVSVKDRYPEDGQMVKVKILHNPTGEIHEIEVVFNDHEDYRSWGSQNITNTYEYTARPTHWMPIPEKPKM